MLQRATLCPDCCMDLQLTTLEKKVYGHLLGTCVSDCILLISRLLMAENFVAEEGNIV